MFWINLQGDASSAINKLFYPTVNEYNEVTSGRFASGVKKSGNS